MRIDVAGAIDEPLVANTDGGTAIYCASQVTLTCTWSGPITLFGTNEFATTPSHTLRLTGDIGGVGTLETSTGGIVELSGNNMYEGTTQSSTNVATVCYLRENAVAIVRTYPVDANSRFTVDASADPALVGSSFGMHVTFDQPGVAERAMYFGLDPFWKAGHESAGVTEPSPTWFLAEGATGPFFETFVLLANPGDQPAEATVTFLPDTGVPVVKTVPIPAQGRVTLNIEAEDASLANAAVATQVSATQPILVERAQYWPDPAPQWYEAHNSFGVTAAGTKWGLAEGRSGGPRAYQTYILLANPGTVKANVTVMFLREGLAPVERTYEVNPKSRFNVDTGAVAELADLYFCAVITSDQPIAVERAMYNNANGQLWAAGTNATATPLP